MFRKRVLYGALACAGTFLCSTTSAVQPTLAAQLPAMVSLPAAAAAAPAAQVTRPIDASVRTVLGGNTNLRITSGADLGALADDTLLEHMLLSLKRSPESEAALRALIDEQHDPKSPKFHQWLTPDQFGSQFGPAAADIAQVVTWLESYGLVVNEIARGGTTIDFSGTAAQVDATFQTSMRRYNLDGVDYVSNDVDPSIPAALAPVVSGVVSLNDAFKTPQMHRKPPAPLLAAAPQHPRSAAPGRTTQFAPYLPVFTYVDPTGATDEDVAPGDFNVIYNVNPAWTNGNRGAGQSVWVLERTRIAQADWNTWRNAFGLSGYAGTFTQTTPNGCADPGQLATGDQGEAALDAEWASAAAPDADIVLYACKSTTSTDGIDLAVSHAVNETNPPAIASLSYGQCESALGTTANTQYNNWWQQAAAEGMTVFVSSGDEGAAGCDADTRSSAPYGWAKKGIAVSGLASTPYNVAVGGTDFRDAADGIVSTYWNTANSTPPYTSALSYVPEIPWNSSCAGSMLLGYLNAHGSSYADSGAYCNSSNGKNLVDVDGGSGGPSAVYAQPSWQSAVYGAPSANVRGLPDVSLFASSGFWGHGLVFCMSDTRSGAGGTACDYTNATDHYYNTAGGTSFAAPALAGIQALVNQASGQRWGNMNTEYYALAAAQYGSPASPDTGATANCNADLGNAIGSNCVFNDVTSGDITVPCLKGSTNCYTSFTGTSSSCGTGAASSAKVCGILSTSTTTSQPAYAATSGWDFATGLGSVNVANLVAAVTPAATTYTIGGHVSGLTASGLVLAVTAGNQTVSVAANATNYVFPTAQPNGTNYTVSVQTQPAGQTCSVANPTGLISGANVTDADVTCTTNTYTIGGHVSGLTASGLVLALTAGNQTVSVAANATNYVFPTAQPNGTNYTVSVQTQPAGLTCSVANQPGTINAADVTNADVTCATTMYTVTATATGGNGTIAPPSQSVASGGTASFTVTPVTGYHASVSGDHCSVTQQGTTTTWTSSAITQDCAVTATFAINTYTLTYTAGANGTLTGNTAQTVNYGASGTPVTAVPATGYHFTSWSDGSTANPRTDTNVQANVSVTASFAINTYTLTYTAGANGTLTGNTAQTVNYGANGTPVTAVPATGYHFTSWSDGSTANPRTDANVHANVNVTASFAINTYTLTYTAGANGTLTGKTSQTVNDGGSGTAVTAVANTGYHFTSWSDGSTANPRTDANVHADVSVTASFAINTYTLTYAAGANGTLSGDTSQTVDDGDSGTAVTAVANTDYHFTSWSDGSTANPRTDANVHASVSVTAGFAANVLVFTTQPANVMQGGTLGSIAVAVQDGSGNTLPVSGTVDFTIAGCGGSVDLGSVTLVNGVATLSSSQVFYTLASGLTVNATSGLLVATSNPFSVGTSTDLIFDNGFDGCRL